VVLQAPGCVGYATQTFSGSPQQCLSRVVGQLSVSQGCIITRPVEDHAVVEVSFHNTQRMSGRVPNVTDFYGFTLGALGSKGAALACPPSADVAHSMVFYR
jgi:hypothetical protein